MSEEELAELVVGDDSGIYKAGFLRDDAPRAVPSDARHDGWFGPEGQKNWHYTLYNELRVALFAQERMTRINLRRSTCPWKLWFA